MIELRVKQALAERFPTDQRPVYTPNGFSGLHLFAWLYPESTGEDRARVTAWLNGARDDGLLSRALAHVIDPIEFTELATLRGGLVPLRRAGVLGSCGVPCYVLPAGCLAVHGGDAGAFTVEAIEPRLTGELWARAQAECVLRAFTGV